MSIGRVALRGHLGGIMLCALLQAIAAIKEDDGSVDRKRETARLMGTIADQRPGKDTTATASRRHGLLILSLLRQAHVSFVYIRLIDHRSIDDVNISNAVYTMATSTGIIMGVG